MLKEQFFDAVARSVITSSSTENDALSLMIVLHTYRFHVSHSVQLDDAGPARILHPLTRSHSSEVIASAFPGSGKQRHDCEYWHRRYLDNTPFEVASSIEGEWRLKTDAMLSRLKQTGLVDDLSEDE